MIRLSKIFFETLMLSVSTKTFLTDDILTQAYDNPKFSNLRCPAATLCPRCQSEFSTVIKETEQRRMLWCNYCGMNFQENGKINATIERQAS